MIKSSNEEIRERFDKDVERFSNLNTGQASTIDAALSLELITEAAAAIRPDATHLLDIGCGAGNYTLAMLSRLPSLHCTLVDLSKPMLDRALQRVSAQTTQAIQIVQGDIRTVELNNGSFDIILAGAVLHHLRDDNDWEKTFARLYALLKPGGCLMISDLVTQDAPELNAYVWKKYGDYLEASGGKEYRQHVLEYVAREDSPRSVTYQCRLMQQVGFTTVDILHKNSCFAAFGGIK